MFCPNDRGRHIGPDVGPARWPAAEACKTVLGSEESLVISAVTMAEALIVAGARDVRPEMERLINGLGLQIITVTSASARRMARAYADWGKGRHAAGLDVGDCFAYDMAKEHRCPLLFVGNNFAPTDVQSAL